MIEIIFIVILILSFAGLIVILSRKIPLLVNIPEPSEDFQKVLASRIKGTAMRMPGIRDFSYELYLQKILSKFRVLTLKTEHKTSNWLETLRQKNNKNGSNNDSYWEELKKAKDGK